MTQTLDALPITRLDKILCSYQNSTSRLQVARIANIPHWYFERVIFPGDLLLFEAVPEAQLEVYSGETVTTLLSDRLLCKRLQI
ncbi:DUF1830 domain-containing protein [Romeria aff. gracilis LEGE 07310]|uniref:DUF1830 domain-containing protein n=1 Tax=Vasconcelosia minhoensis LEGE 07310 TaxID=915328 RepID=A0A8J7AUM1_9CYAN|nr:DUF1830 domain-containing protein [Romeria gracilis]MBE9079659.1 DUF1830 domain-containing protein [Romeria aff. gracilis LEGE 07310]